MKSLIIKLLLITSTLFISCGSNETKTEKPVNNVKPETEKVWEEFTIEAVGNTMMDMQYSLKNISVNAGSWVKINLINIL